MPSTPISGPVVSSTARWMVFSSSRTLPGQRCSASVLRASADSGRTGTPLASAYFLAKNCASSITSAGRSRSGGIFRFTTLSRNSRSSRNLPSRAASARLRFEVAMMRMSTGTGRVPPTRSMTRSWMARRSLACSRTSISEISSSSSVPPVASSNLPMRRATAPVNEPFSWPNSSDSEQVLRDRRAVDADERLLGAVGAGVDVARQHLLAGAGFAGDQHRGVGGGDLLRELHHLRHRLVAPDEFAGVVGDGGEHGRDQLGIGRQRDVFLGAGVDRGDRGAGVVLDAAGDDRHMDVLELELARRGRGCRPRPRPSAGRRPCRSAARRAPARSNSAWVTAAPRSIAILVAVVSWPLSVPTMRSRMVRSFLSSFPP